MRRAVILWFYLVASLHGLASGQAPVIRQVGPFQDFYTCEAARSAENPALWRSEKCFDEFADPYAELLIWGMRGRP